MSLFDQRGQRVTYQYNAAGNINFGAVDSRPALAAELEKLKLELGAAQEAGALDADAAKDADYQLGRAAEQAQNPTADKNRVVRYLEGARDLITEGATAAGAVTGLVGALDAALQQVHRLF